MDPSKHGEHLLLIDGHHLFHRTYNALPRSIVGVDGAPIQGVYGFVGAFLKLVRQHAPTHVCVAFDPPVPPFRRDLFPGYRTGRPRGTPEEVANFDAQVDQVQQVLDYMQVRHVMVSGFEADDALGTLADVATVHNLPVTIVSGDRDLLQLVSPTVQVYMPKGQDGEIFTPDMVLQRFGVRPDQFVAYKALIGDNSDLIPGVPGIGPRTAAALITRHGAIDALYDALPTLQPRQSAALEAHRERVSLNVRLMTIVKTLELPSDPATYRWTVDPAWSASALLGTLHLRAAKT